MEERININVSATEYDKTSKEIKRVLGRMEEMVHGQEDFLITDSALYDNPFTIDNEYSVQKNKIKKSLDFFLKSNEYIDEASDDFLADYLVMLLTGIGSKLGKRNDIKDLDPWIKITFNSVILSISSYQREEIQ